MAAIIEAAARILETLGPSGFTTNAIAERAGVGVGSLYQYFPNKDAITLALIRRELAAIEAAVVEIDSSGQTPDALGRFVEVAVSQQLRRPSLAKHLEGEEERLSPAHDVGPARERVGAALAAILAADGRPAGPDLVQDIIALTAALVNAAANRGEHDSDRLAARVQTVIESRLAAS